LGHEVTVITRSANRRAIEEQAQRTAENLSFVYYDLPQWMQRLRRYPGGKALYYVLWQWLAARQVRRLFPALPFDTVQHVTYASIRYPSFMGSLGVPFYFGPVAGGEAIPPHLRAGLPAGQRWHERLRDVSNFFVPLDPLMRRTFRQAERILVTRDTLPLVCRRWRDKTTVQLAVGHSEHGLTLARPGLRPKAGELRLLYVGRLLECKGLDIALDAVSQVKQSHPNIRFTIIGDGPAKPRLARLSRELGLEEIVGWVGWLPQRALVEHYRAADLLLFPSLRDSGGMVVLESLAHGLPVLCTDLGGPGVIVDSTCGRALPTMGRSREQLARDMAGALLEMATVPNLLASLSCGARARARQFNFQDLVQSVYPTPAARRIPRQA